MDTVILIGNTNTRIVWLTKRSIQKVTTVKTQGLEMVIPKMTFEKVGCVFVASVVPDATSVVKKFIPDIRQITWKDFPKKIKVKEPQKVGIDRLLNAIGGWSLAKTECLIIDAGSAITIDLVNKNGDFEGGVIFPGEKLIVESLKNLALLKNIKVSKPASLLGKNTSEAIGSGIFFG
ncbi:MAG: type III pantothenate kinase, partial [Candidatus Omnitrophica bacterium]|nr:type III pantothenate kinase [Candidatus Omnitrophota bacterium]